MLLSEQLTVMKVDSEATPKFIAKKSITRLSIAPQIRKFNSPATYAVRQIRKLKVVQAAANHFMTHNEFSLVFSEHCAFSFLLIDALAEFVL